MSLESEGRVKKLVIILETSTLVTVVREEEVGENLGANLAWVSCIHYPINFGKISVLALFDSNSEINAVCPAFAKKPGLSIRPTDMEVQKIDGTTLETYEIVVAAFSIKNKANQVRFFQATFLMAKISPEVVLGMPFLISSGANVNFLGRKLQWRSYPTQETLPNTRRIELVGKKEFTATTLDLEYEIYVVHVGSVSSDASPSFSPLEVDFHPFHRPQISGLIAKEALTKVPAEYLDFTDVFSPDLASELSEHTGINNHAIELVDGQQPPYGPIHNLRPVELETLKAYIETNLANRFIRPFKSPAVAPILFNRKSDGFL